MSRISYADDEDFTGQFALWDANCDRSIHGRAGQRALRELEAALVAMPEKRLVREDFVTPQGEACALGSLAIAKAMARGLSRDEAIAEAAKLDPEESEAHGIALGLPRLVAWKVVNENDTMNGRVTRICPGPNLPDAHYPSYSTPGVYRSWDVTPEERYDNMLAWVREQIMSAEVRR